MDRAARAIAEVVLAIDAILMHSFLQKDRLVKACCLYEGFLVSPIEDGGRTRSGWM